MPVLVTGVAGFIGSHVAQALLARGEAVIGIDNFSDYYDPVLKFARLKPLREDRGFTFLEADIADREAVDRVLQYGAHQLAFTAAIKNGGQFSADTTILLMQIVCASVVSVMSGFLAALIARENKRAPLILGLLLTAFGLLKAVMSWPYVPIWYHVIFTALLMPMAIMGGKLKTTA